MTSYVEIDTIFGRIQGFPGDVITNQTRSAVSFLSFSAVPITAKFVRVHSWASFRSCAPWSDFKK
jgi:hypothetical protein